MFPLEFPLGFPRCAEVDLNGEINAKQLRRKQKLDGQVTDLPQSQRDESECIWQRLRY